MSHFYDYANRLNEALCLVDTAVLNDVLAVLKEARHGRTVFVFGNGGSGATASHFAGDVMKSTYQGATGTVARAICLNDNMTGLLAYANDEGYETVFARPLASMMGYGDVVIGISTSGESENVVNGLQAAVGLGGIAIGLTGKGGGRVGQVARYHVAVPGETIEQVEDGHLAVLHWLVQGLKA
jgi:D-sedoheptulose 7-phosphate isomerase